MKLMRTILLPLLLLSLCALAYSRALVGAFAPNFTAKTASGKTITLKEFLGKIVVLEWTNAQCPFVKKYYTFQDMQKMQREFTKTKKVIWLRIISSAPGKEGYVDAKEALALAKKQHVHATYTILDPEGKLGKPYGARTTPDMFVIDKEGKVAYQGAIDSIRSAGHSDIKKAVPYVKNAINALLKGEKVPVTSALPYGCSIKY